MKIAVVGYARTGKDSVHGIINKYYMGYAHKIAFGDSLKDELFRLFPNLPKEPKPRREMELFGQGMREIQPDIWIEKLANRMLICEGLGIEHFVVTDCRQPNESKWLVEQGFTIIYVHADSEIRKERAKNDKEFIPVGISEQQLHMIEYDYKVVNNGTIEELEEQIVGILKDMGEIQ